MLRFAHRFTTHNRFIAPQKICQEILNFYTSHPDSPDWLKNITVLPAGAQSSATAKEITLEMALRLCADLVRTGLRPGRYSGNYSLHAACKDGSALQSWNYCLKTVLISMQKISMAVHRCTGLLEKWEN